METSQSHEREVRVDQVLRRYREARFESNINSLIDIANRTNDIEVDNFVMDQFTHGLFLSDISLIHSSEFTNNLDQDDVVAVCAVHDSEALVQPYLEHYDDIGVKHFVFINNNSSDETVRKIVDSTSRGTHVDIWNTEDRFDGFKAMGWKQRMFNLYGLDKWYLNLDIDEHFVYPNSENETIQNLTARSRSLGRKAVGSMLLDMYPKTANNLEGSVDEIGSLGALRNQFSHYDSTGYTLSGGENGLQRLSGGPRTRVFDRHPSLQKTPLILVESGTVAINPHFVFPYELNPRMKTELDSALLHYKFLPGDLAKYRKYIESGVHWDNSSQYRSYVTAIDAVGTLEFYDPSLSREYTNFNDLKLEIT